MRVLRLSAKQHLALGALGAVLVLAIAIVHPTEAHYPLPTSLRIALGVFVAAAVMGLGIATYRLKTITAAEREALIRWLERAPKLTDRS